MTTTGYATADERRHWHRIEFAGWAIVAAVSAAAFTELVVFIHVRPLLAFLGIVAALDLPFCLDLIWRAGRADSTAASAGDRLPSSRRRPR